MAEYKLIQSDRVALLEMRVNQALADGYAPYGQLSQMGGVHTQVMGKGITMGGGGSGGSGAELKVANLGDVATVNLADIHKDKLLLVAHDGECIVTMPKTLGGTDDKPFMVMINNSKGAIKVKTEGTLVSFANAASKGVTIGCLNTGESWVVTGTSQELAE